MTQETSKDANSVSPDPAPVLRKVMGIIATFLLLFGLATFVFGMVCAARWVHFSENTELPLGGAKRLAVSPEGTIYVGSGFYQRIQAYTSNGRFLRSYSDVLTSSFRLSVDKDGNLHVATADGKRYYIYNADGRLISTDYDVSRDVYQMIGTMNEPRPTDRSGATYSLRTALLWPRVVKMESDGRESTVVSQGLLLTLIAGPLPAWLYIALGLLIFWYLERRALKESSKGESSKGESSKGGMQTGHS